MAIIIDKEFQSLIPPPSVEELKQLEANLIADGCRDPLVVWSEFRAPIDFADIEAATESGNKVYCKYCYKNVTVSIGDGNIQCDKCGYGLAPLEMFETLIDGHNRYEICERLGIQYAIEPIEFETRDEVLLWIIKNQKGRRNLSDLDRIMLAQAEEAIIAKRASANKGTRTDLGAKLRSGEKIKTSKVAAKSAGVGERTYDAGKLILTAAATGEIAPEVVEDVRRGRAAIHRVAKEIKDKRQKATRKAKRQQAAAESKAVKLNDLHIGDFRQLSDEVANDSVSLIFTDPPYDRKATELFDGLGKFAADKLCDGGSLVCYVGHIQLREALASLDAHLRFWWIACCLHSGRQALMAEYGIRVGWKPVLWFVKNTRDDKQNILCDVMSGGEEKSHHDWQQSVAEAEYWIEKLCPADGIVCDPFIGGGTTAVAAKRQNRKWVGFEIDADQAAIATERIAS